jgi:DNA polymerase III subunit gamma/tau
MTHTALARKYRPLTFSEVATQEHVSATLRRAVATGRVGHAYLFAGPRGVGKTTLARVLAMALNCPNRTPEGEPCGSCRDCEQIWGGSSALDVVEIDAASNRGVDDARDLRERAQYAPSSEDRHKVYIVDEAHMLTREAWNALLKILEEPPPRVHFIFATTEPQKIEQTAAPILSRCQRFDFRRMGMVDIVDRIREVLAREGVQASDEALRLVARKANGGMRDALSLTDQVLALSEGPVEAETVRRILGVVGDDHYLHLFDVLAARDRAGVFRLVESLLDQGFDLVEFYHGLTEALRNLLRLRVGGGTEGEIPLERQEEWRARAEFFDPGDLVRMLGMAAELEVNGSLRRTQQPRILLELLLLRFAWMDRTLEVEAVLRALGGEPIPEALPTHSAPPLPLPLPVAPSPQKSPEVAPAAVASPAVAPPALRPPEPEPEIEPEPDPEPEPEIEPELPGEPEAPPASPASGMDPVAAWALMVERGTGFPPGMSPLLPSVGAEASSDGLRLQVPEGLVHDRLSDPSVRPALEAELSRLSGRPILLSFQTAASGSTGASVERISTEEVRQGRLDDLLQEEPGLREAVEALDLEPLD